MINSLSDAASIALSGLQSAQSRVASDAFNIASGNTIQNPSSGSQRNNPAGLLLQNGGSSSDLISNTVDLLSAKASYKASAAVLKVSNSLYKTALDTLS